MPIQVIAPIRDQGLNEQLALAQVLAQGARGFQDYQARQKQQQGEQAVLQALMRGTPGSIGRGTGFAGSPELGGQTNAAIGGMSEQEALAALAAGAAPEILAQRYAPPKPGEGFSLSPGQIRYDASGRVVAQAPAETEGPLSSAGKIAADLGVDIRTPEGQAAVERVLKAGGTSISVAGPTGPAATIASMAPGAMSDLASISQQLLDPATGAVNTQLLATMNVPGLNAAVPNTAGAQMRSALEGAMDTMVRIRTGAAATEQELAQMRQIYMPSVLDTPATVRSKLDRLQRDLNASLAIATQGKAVPEETQKPEPTPPAEPGIVDRIIQQGMSAITEGGAPQPQAGQQVGPDQLGEGEIIRNPLTGETLIVRDGKLVPYGG